MSEEKVSYRFVAENNVVIEIEPEEAQNRETEKRINKFMELIKKEKKED